MLAADDWVVIPTGVAHGFLALDALELLYLVTNEYDGSDELGFAWDDPTAAVPWPPVAGDAGRPADPVRPRPLEPVARRAGGAPPRLGASARRNRVRRPSQSLSSIGRSLWRATHQPPLSPQAHQTTPLRLRPHLPVRSIGPAPPGPSRDWPHRPRRARFAGTHPGAVRSRPPPDRPPSRPEPALRRLAAAAALAALTAFGVSAPAAAAVPVSNAKVVIIVGATEGTTSTYRSYADQAYAEAIKYTSQVTKVYSPNATWSKVKAAVAGANIVLYYGHGNGWPSPYTYDPQYTTKDGMGLNDPTHLSDSVHKYYGEPSMAQLGLAPNAIVLLGNLCYASGNSEPGGTAPTRRPSPASGSTTTRPAS